MSAASSSQAAEFRPKILERRARLQAAASSLSPEYLADLLAEIDSALHRIEGGSFGFCQTCHDPIETDRLECNPLLRFCLDHLDARERRAHEQDLQLATEIQSRLLPSRNVSSAEWATHYRYEPAGLVGGDYCEIAPSAAGSLFFAVGDISGKGVAASLLMTHLSAIFRSLLSLDLGLADLMLRANRLLCESTPAAHYATLAAGRATPFGVELCNAGHCRPLLFRGGQAAWIDPCGLPLGIFCDGRYTPAQFEVGPGDALVLYSDGITEARNPEGEEYGEEGLLRALSVHSEQDPERMVTAVLEDIARFRGSCPPHDDVTLLVLRRRQVAGPPPAVR